MDLPDDLPEINRSCQFHILDSIRKLKGSGRLKNGSSFIKIRRNGPIAVALSDAMDLAKRVKVRKKS